MIAIVAALLLSHASGVSLRADAKPIEVEVLEINETSTLRQVILWRWQFLATGHNHHVAQWFVIGEEKPSIRPSGNRFLVCVAGKQFLVRSVRQTNTRVDPEMRDRQFLNECDRKPYFATPFPLQSSHP